MNIYVYPTDPEWYTFLSRQPDLDEVNFWRPGGVQPFRQLNPGDLLLFRMRGGLNMIGGGGIFTHFHFAPLSKAWEAFGVKNGTSDYPTLLRLIARNKRIAIPEQADSSIIGCIILSWPFFFTRERWIPVPPEYPINSPQGHRFDSGGKAGSRLLAALNESLSSTGPRVVAERPFGEDAMNSAVEYRQTLTRRRLGQGAFSFIVADAYQKRCAVSGERTYPVLEAAHIKPVHKGGLHRVDNGLLLRSDIHKLLDAGYVTITPQGTFRVSGRLEAEWHNGRIYYELDGRSVRAPTAPEFAPHREFLEWHRDTIFKG